VSSGLIRNSAAPSCVPPKTGCEGRAGWRQGLSILDIPASEALFVLVVVLVLVLGFYGNWFSMTRTATKTRRIELYFATISEN
jgi:hypothetical protein